MSPSPAPGLAVTTPDDAPTVATDVFRLVHVPPGVLLSVVVLPPHNTSEPVIALGVAFTVIGVTVRHPPPIV